MPLKRAFVVTINSSLFYFESSEPETEYPVTNSFGSRSHSDANGVIHVKLTDFLQHSAQS